ncbi:MAG TPA: DegT/DnrJ/EryC1/StrS family aminotransferase [Candidatus Polarisedimenticolia bacterium]|jgi:perosamine synthetase|nr:DegT/DnrJ/EryC1/StrS family aminotransferase [Candidatus Polarisedimenticolia bacterium]
MRQALRVPHAETPVPHARPCLGREEEGAALGVLRSGWLAPGAQAAAAAERLAGLAGCTGAVLLSSGTTALTLALRAIGVQPRDQVALPSYACAALLHAVRAVPARPLVCDIDPQTLGLSLEDLDRRARGPVGAAIVVHPFGVPVRIEPFRARGIRVVEDCAQAIGASVDRAPVGSRGDLAVFSFGPTKPLTCGGPGGGVAATPARLLASVVDLASHDEQPDDRPRVNGLMGDLHAAILRVQLGRLGAFRDRRAAIARRYDEAFAPLGLARPPSPPGIDPLVYRYGVRLPDADRCLRELNRRGIVARRPVHTPLHVLLGLREPFPHAERAQREMVSLPIFPALTDREVERVITEVRQCLS